jgi:hypothetical protein
MAHAFELGSEQSSEQHLSAHPFESGASYQQQSSEMETGTTWGMALVLPCLFPPRGHLSFLPGALKWVLLCSLPLLERPLLLMSGTETQRGHHLFLLLNRPSVLELCRSDG